MALEELQHEARQDLAVIDQIAGTQNQVRSTSYHEKGRSPKTLS